MPEYGRSVQTMVNLAIRLKKREERQRCAAAIFKTMSSLMPPSANKEDNELRIWNHMARIANYRLDIDYPVHIVPPEEAQAHPAPLHYPAKHIKRRHYGHLVEQALAHATSIQDAGQRKTFVESIANQMKQDLYIWNRDAMDEAIVAHDIERYTGGSITLDLQNHTFDAVGESPLQTGEGMKKRKRKK